MSIIFIIPAYNEEQNIVNLLRQTSKKMLEMNLEYRIYVVNNGSTDRTQQIVEELMDEIPIVLINQGSDKRGVGEAFKVGFKKALENISDGDIIITKEADNTSDIRILEKMIERLNQDYDLVLASCFCKGGEVVNSTWDRHLLSFSVNALIKAIFNMKGIHTFSSFYRAFNADTLKNAFSAYDGTLITKNGFECMVEMLIKLRRLPIKIAEVPMTLDVKKRLDKSKMKRRKTIMGYLRLIRDEALRDRKKDKKVYKHFMELR